MSDWHPHLERNLANLFKKIPHRHQVIREKYILVLFVAVCLIDQVHLLMRSLPQTAGHLDSHPVSPRVIRSPLTASLCLISCHIHLCVKPCVPWHREAFALFSADSGSLTACRVLRRARQIPPLNTAAWGKYGPFYEGGFKWWVRVIACEAVSRGDAARPRSDPNPWWE